MVEDFSGQAQQSENRGHGGTSENGTSSVLLDEQKAVRIYERNLSYWRQEGCTYFVTFREVDSIPEGVRRDWEYEQTMWLQARGIRYDGPRGVRNSTNARRRNGPHGKRSRR